MEFCSLWLDTQRISWPQLQSDLSCDIAVIGAGISGVATLYYLLTCTELSVALFERNLIASGATGHNGGLPTIHIERSISELIDEFGSDLVGQIYRDMEEANDALFAIHEQIGFLENLVPLSAARLGFYSFSSFIDWLEREQLYLQAGRERWSYWLLNEEELIENVPETYRDWVSFVSQEEILAALETKDRDCIAIGIPPEPRVRMNSALFCDRVLQYLAKQFSSRCFIYENTEISHIDLGKDRQVLQHALGRVITNDLVLCTNAYTGFSIFDSQRQKPVTKLRKAVFPREGYLAAYTTSLPDNSLLVFLGEEISHPDAPYWYLSAAPLTRGAKESIACLGGPEYTLSHIEQGGMHTEASLVLMQQFCTKHYGGSFPSFPYFWHGTMGYTQTGLRWVGQDLDHPHLWYNLGCNGIGILPALAGAKRIARQMGGESLAPSLFDPPKETL